MNLKRAILLSSAVCLLALILGSSTILGAPARYEYYTATDDGGSIVYGVYWKAETFTVNVTAHSVTSIKLKMYRVGSPIGTVMVHIRATDGSGHPTGSDLTSGSLDGDTISTTATWYEFTVTEYNLSASTKYAICFSAYQYSNASNYIYLRRVISGSYDGTAEQSSTNGSTWTTAAGSSDYVFEVWGNPIAAGSGWTKKCLGVTNSQINKVMGVPKANIKKVDGVP